MTEQCNLPDGFSAGAAIKASTHAESIAIALDEIASMSVSDLQSMGAKGRALVERKYTWSSVAASLLGVYRWISGNGEKPDCVVS